MTTTNMLTLKSKMLSDLQITLCMCRELTWISIQWFQLPDMSA